MNEMDYNSVTLLLRLPVTSRDTCIQMQSTPSSLSLQLLLAPGPGLITFESVRYINGLGA